uniref:Uncharacterized protein n=1 Tax=Arcella intermedia TaxID=1963864 RepID=A0A6B2LET6_9EUKA
MAATKNINATKIFIKAGANLEAKENDLHWTPLFYAIHANNVQIVKLLIDLKADVNSRTKNYEQTPLMLSCYMGRIEITSLLLGAHADVHLKDKNGETALHLSVKEGHLEVVKLLINHKNTSFFEESGLGLNPLDISIIKLLSPLPGHRVTQSSDDVSISSKYRNIYHYLHSVLGTNRELATYTQVNRVNDLMLESAYIAAKKDTRSRQHVDDFHPNSLVEYSVERMMDMPPMDSSVDEIEGCNNECC